MNYQQLRKKYPKFYFHGVDIVESNDTLEVYFDYEIVGLTTFRPSYTLPKPEGRFFANTLAVKEAAFSMGMMELVKYWKLTCSPEVVIEGNALSEEQMDWWKYLYYCLLDEFFEVNEIKVGPKTFMSIKCEGEALEGDELDQVFKGNLVPVGGGKDSYVSLEILKDQKEDNHCFIINEFKAALEAVEVTGYKDRLALVHRNKDPKLAELNEKGYLKGYVPMSAIIAFAAVLQSLLLGKKCICMSIESNESEFTRRGKKIRHQYTKDYQFEKDFNAYVNKYITKEVTYFSLLRPITELQIVSIFVTLKDYLPVFKSCAAAQDKGEWCGRCARCLHVYMELSAFLQDKELIKIFGSNLLEDPAMAALMHELTGMDDNHPYDCQGSRDEINTAIAMAIKLRKELHKPLPMLYEDYMNSSYYEVYENKNNYVDYYCTEHGLPAEYEERLKHKIEECWNETN